MLDGRTLQLFGAMPRDVGSPFRRSITSVEQLTQFIDYNDGAADCFVSANPFGCIDKIFLDFDSRARLCSHNQALKDAQRVYSYLTSQGYTVEKIASGKKGIHLHVIFSPYRYTSPTDAKDILWHTTIQLLTDVFGELAFGSEYDINGSSVRVVYAVDEGDRILGCDPSVFGDINRLCRIPNTRRPPENLTWCTWLPDSFAEMDWYDVVLWSKMPHIMGPIEIPAQKITDIKVSDEVRNMRYNHISSPAKIVDVQPGHENIILKAVLRTCLYKHIAVPNPTHIARVAATIDLLRFWSPTDIMTMYSMLNWADWDPQITADQIRTCRKYRPFSCATLRKYGLCLYSSIDQCPDRNGSAIREEAQVNG